MKSLLYLAVMLASLLAKPQAPPAVIKVHKDTPVDSAFFSLQDFAVFTKHNGFKNRYKSVKHFQLDVCYRGKVTQYSLHGNYLPRRTVKELYRTRAKNITLKFHDIEPVEDSAYVANPYKLAPFECHVRRRLKIARFLFGAWSFPLPFWVSELTVQ